MRHRVLKSTDAAELKEQEDDVVTVSSGIDSYKVVDYCNMTNDSVSLSRRVREGETRESVARELTNEVHLLQQEAFNKKLELYMMNLQSIYTRTRK